MSVKKPIELPPLTPEQEREIKASLKHHKERYRNTHPDHFRAEDEKREYDQENRDRRQGEDRW